MVSPNIELKIHILRRFGTQVVLANKIEMDEVKLSKIIHGRAKPTQEEKRKIAWALQVPIKQLFRE